MLEGKDVNYLLVVFISTVSPCLSFSVHLRLHYLTHKVLAYVSIALGNRAQQPNRIVAVLQIPDRALSTCSFPINFL